jgi:hypothetical protein
LNVLKIKRGRSLILGMYFGLQAYLGVIFKETTIWNQIIEKKERRLAGWKRLYPSKRVRSL